MVIVLMESMSGSGHKYATLREKVAGKLEQYKFDPAGKYQNNLETKLLRQYFFLSCNFLKGK